ncbi:hypothetical protein QAD02_002047 [Eretmocerus hayati]|uniref:Uncharacterized protein n=1 Tax=Eretmocerus hayati TaxID=131215 RepID=A0ACC2NJ04_9HYME|nr:hypothetical protein QAD02_002047 [Eretmocerus hayati]
MTSSFGCQVSENLLQVYLDEYPETPWDALKYLIAGICYGGHVTDDWDRRLLLTYVEDYMNDSLLNVNLYRLSSLATYHVPRDGSLESYRDHVSALPMTDRPEAFGQHPNADITSLIIETRMTFETLASMQPQQTGGSAHEPGGDAEDDAAMSVEDRVMQLAQEIEARLPKEMDYERTERMMPRGQRSPLEVILLQEMQRYNELLRRCRTSLEQLCRAIRGLVLMSPELEDIFACVHEGRVPASWSRAYPSLKPLGSWTRELAKRVEHFSRWAESARPPAAFWLAAFTFPTGFLTAVLQTAARRSGLSVDSLSWEFLVLQQPQQRPDDELANLRPPEDGVYIRSMYLEGAGWDKKLGCLVDPAPMQLVYNMPVIHFKPAEQTRKKTKGMYSCPCYYYPQRSGDEGRPAFVVTVDLNAGAESAAFWTKRGTALLLSLST